MKLNAAATDTGHFVARINLRETDRLDHWCCTFGVTREQLSDAVSTVGSNPDLVRRHLRVRNQILY